MRRSWGGTIASAKQAKQKGKGARRLDEHLAAVPAPVDIMSGKEIAGVLPWLDTSNALDNSNQSDDRDDRDDWGDRNDRDQQVAAEAGTPLRTTRRSPEIDYDGSPTRYTVHGT